MFQTIQIQEVFHIGTLDESKRTSLNYEGKGLSISLHPKEWQIICRGKISGKPFSLINPNSKFAVFNKNDDLLETLAYFGLINNYVTEVKKISFTYYDDEAECEFIEYFNSVEDFEDSWGDEKFKIIDILSPTNTLRELMSPVSVSDEDPYVELFNLYIQKHFDDYDGLWFNRPLDVLSYQAPAGLIFDHKKDNWEMNSVSDSMMPPLTEYRHKIAFNISQFLL